MLTIQTHVAGIPCQAVATSYWPADPGRLSGPPEYCYPSEPAEVEFKILDRKGRVAAWLERKASDTDRERIEIELIEAILESGDE